MKRLYKDLQIIFNSCNSVFIIKEYLIVSWYLKTKIFTITFLWGTHSQKYFVIYSITFQKCTDEDILTNRMSIWRYYLNSGSVKCMYIITSRSITENYNRAYDNSQSCQRSSSQIKHMSGQIKFSQTIFYTLWMEIYGVCKRKWMSGQFSVLIISAVIVSNLRNKYHV